LWKVFSGVLNGLPVAKIGKLWQATIQTNCHADQYKE
jgi:hypothetical protein